ncbi:cation transporter [Beijerinckia sp. L45]|uniref:cation transporter n=1 Tax=Beijerinckia sp. L45 TaxID=1641855 RepID=UPI00131D3A7F|nr:cation transporter [Beijerinckia sp. L45]
MAEHKILSSRVLRSSLRGVVALNLAAFAGEVGVALVIGSVSLVADSVDFLEDASINLLILVAVLWSARARARLGMGLAGIILVPSLATLAMARHQFGVQTPPSPVALALTGFGALVVNGTCAWMLARHRHAGGSLMKAAFLSARNDTVANAAIIVAGLVTAATRSAWPDLTVGAAIGLLNAGAAWEVYSAARAEQSAPSASELKSDRSGAT